MSFLKNSLPSIFSKHGLIGWWLKAKGGGEVYLSSSVQHCEFLWYWKNMHGRDVVQIKSKFNQIANIVFIQDSSFWRAIIRRRNNFYNFLYSNTEN